MIRSRPSRRRGFTLLEVSLSTLFVGLMLVASLSTVGSVLRQRARTAVEHRATLLAQQLMEEILACEYVEPTETPVFGPESSELSNRAKYDDVDDYHLCDQSPPADITGAALAGLTGWRRRVTVQYVDPANPSTTSVTDLGAKRISVEVLENGRLAVTLQSLKVDSWPE